MTGRRQRRPEVIRRAVRGWLGPVEPTDARDRCTPDRDGPDRDTPDGGSHHGGSSDDGRAILEVVFLAVLMLIPIIYLLISLIRIQAATLAVTQAARDAGRAIDTAPTIDDGISRAHQIAAIDLADQHISTDDITLQFITPGAACTADNTITPSLTPGAVYDLCVTTTLTLPGVPTILAGRDNTATGVYTIHISELREGP